MYLIFDTETTGFPSKGLDRSNPKQARICQLAWILLDKNFKCLEQYCELIRPDGWTISSGAFAAHGIAHEECVAKGVDIFEAMQIFEHVLLFNSTHKIAHNLKFDAQLIDIEANNEYGWEYMNPICTMELMTPVCKLPSKRMTYKWPKLQEAYQYCFNESFEGAHNALADCIATARVFRWLVEHRHVTV